MKHTTTHLAEVVTSLVMLLAFLVIATVGHAAATPCESDDQTNCYWDAQSSGNGLGSSYVGIGPWTVTVP